MSCSSQHPASMLQPEGLKCAVGVVQKAWDQSVFNQEIFYLTHGSYTAPNVSVRVMDINSFMNSKVSRPPCVAIRASERQIAAGIWVIRLSVKCVIAHMASE